MPQTRSRIAMQDTEKRVRGLTTELLKAQELNIKLMKEQEDYSDEYNNLLGQIATLKASLAAKEMDNKELILQNNKLNEKAVRRLQDITEYEEALNIIKMHESNAVLFEQLYKTTQLENDQLTDSLNKEIEGHKNMVLDLQREIIQLKNYSVEMKTDKNKYKNKTENSMENKIKNLKKKNIQKMLIENKEQIIVSTEKCSQQRSATTCADVHNVTASPEEFEMTEVQKETTTQPEHKLEPIHKKCLILCDSYGKSLARFIKQNTTAYKSVLSVCKPDAPLREIVRNLASLTATMREGDDVIVIASDYKEFKLEIVRFVRGWCKQNKLKFQITSLPYLCSRSRRNMEVNRDIFSINTELLKLATHSNGMSVVDINQYKNRIFRSRYTVCNMFLKFLSDIMIHNSLFEYTHIFDNLTYLTHGYSNPSAITEDVSLSADEFTSETFLVKHRTELQPT